MTEASSFSSLLALVDSHLSKTGIRSKISDNSFGHRLTVPTLNGIQNGTKSETLLSFGSGQRLSIPMSNSKEPSISDVLAEQVANMLRAKEQKRQQEEEEKERKRLAEEMEKLRLEETANDYIIDLTQALQTPCGGRHPQQQKEEILSRSDSFESLFAPKLLEPKSEPLLPCITDMSYILKRKVRRSRGSAFGRVLTSRLRPVAAPYLREKVESNIVKFDFSTKSPCDLAKERLRRPIAYNTHKGDIFNVA